MLKNVDSKVAMKGEQPYANLQDSQIRLYIQTWHLLFQSHALRPRDEAISACRLLFSY